MHFDLATVLRPLSGAPALLALSALVSHAKVSQNEVSQNQERDRSKIPDDSKWDLTAICPSDQAWRATKDELASELHKLRQFQGTLASSASRLADALETQSSFDKELNRLFVYAAMKSHEDTRVSTYQGMQQEMVQLGSVLGTESAFIEPEILKMDNATIERFLAQEPRLHVFRHDLEDIARRRAHTLSKRRREAPRRVRRDGQRAFQRLSHFRQCRFSLSFRQLLDKCRVIRHGLRTCRETILAG
jgi:oligoendopeptidase F